mmetsp:Transcript_10517/g.30535  ORF Transcript_10517/g.30535 Transcript_10517/m.30535 type:complete len:240 (-) Transcript_10517:71-790(-)
MVGSHSGPTASAARLGGSPEPTAAQSQRRQPQGAASRPPVARTAWCGFGTRCTRQATWCCRPGAGATTKSPPTSPSRSWRWMPTADVCAPGPRTAWCAFGTWPRQGRRAASPIGRGRQRPGPAGRGACRRWPSTSTPRSGRCFSRVAPRTAPGGSGTSVSASGRRSLSSAGPTAAPWCPSPSMASGSYQRPRMVAPRSGTYARRPAGFRERTSSRREARGRMKPTKLACAWVILPLVQK